MTGSGHYEVWTNVHIRHKKDRETPFIIHIHTSTSCKSTKPSSVPSAIILPSGLQQIDVMHFPEKLKYLSSHYLLNVQRRYNHFNYKLQWYTGTECALTLCVLIEKISRRRQMERDKMSAVEQPGEIVHSLCQLKRWRRTLESSVTIASRSFSGFHSAIFIYE